MCVNLYFEKKKKIPWGTSKLIICTFVCTAAVPKFIFRALISRVFRFDRTATNDKKRHTSICLKSGNIFVCCFFPCYLWWWAIFMHFLWFASQLLHYFPSITAFLIAILLRNWILSLDESRKYVVK